MGFLAHSKTVGCVVLMPSGRVRTMNALFRSWLGLSRDKVDPLIDPQTLKRALATGSERVSFRVGPDDHQTTVCGEILPCGENGELIGVFRAAQSNEQLTAGMERNARLEALANLASGVAHDFNNLLTILVGNLSLVAEELRHDPKQFGKLKVARDAARRGGDLIKQLLSFARQEAVASRPIDPAGVIARVAPLIEKALGQSVALQLELDEGLDPIQGNSGQLESVIVNLAVNARDAIGDKGRVRIRVASDPGSGKDENRALVIEVTDNGSGMPAAVVDRAFEPYFTSKGDGRGTGLGLSMVRHYAEQFGGSAGIVSRPGVGTTVRLRFPVISASVEDSMAMTAPVAALPNGSEHVLIATVDGDVSTMIVHILSTLGYRCSVSLEGGALGLGPSGADLMISDDTGALSRARAIGVAVLGLGVAGWSFDGGPVLQKPFSLPDLALAVRSALDQPK